MGIELQENERLRFKPNTEKKSAIKAMLANGNILPGEEIKNIPLDLIDNLEAFEHPFEKTMKRGIERLAESIERIGVQEAVILRPKTGGRYELLAGHRRTAASRMAGITEIPAIVKNIDDDEARLIVTDTNLEQREEILLSEKAKAYKMQLEAIKRVAGRPKINCGQVVHNFEDGRKSIDIIAETSGENRKQIQRYIRLNELIEPLLDMVDDKGLPFVAAVELSYLKAEEQEALLLVITERNMKISIEIAQILRSSASMSELNYECIQSLLFPETEQKPKTEKPTYKKTISNVEKFIRKDKLCKEKMEQADMQKLESILKNAILSYFSSL